MSASSERSSKRPCLRPAKLRSSNTKYATKSTTKTNKSTFKASRSAIQATNVKMGTSDLYPFSQSGLLSPSIPDEYQDLMFSTTDRPYVRMSAPYRGPTSGFNQYLRDVAFYGYEEESDSGEDYAPTTPVSFVAPVAPTTPVVTATFFAPQIPVLPVPNSGRLEDLKQLEAVSLIGFQANPPFVLPFRPKLPLCNCQFPELKNPRYNNVDDLLEIIEFEKALLEPEETESDDEMDISEPEDAPDFYDF